MIFTPRPWQKPMIGHLLSLDRANLFARPGMGKTTTVLAALDALSLADDVFPALVIGPKRVANSVWSGDVEKFANLRHIRVVRITGNTSERLAALRTPADVYTIHYGLLKWLAEALAGKWPFKTVVADESTRLKSARPSFQRHKGSGKVFLRVAGSANAGTLARFAPKTRHWFNLSGTPAPNGLKDLWAQCWFIDFGETLGGSFDAFTRRWFVQRRGTSAEQSVFDPLPHAQDEITRRIKPYSLSLDPRDWFDLREPRIVPVKITLPERLMKEYRKLHREAVLVLGEQTVITAVSAGVATIKCLQYASGAVLDADGTAHHIHDEKLDALDSLRENLAGAPLLVAYHFRSSLAAILKRFPDAEQLPSDATKQRDTERRWNEGRIPMLVVHPASAGHGLNLQHGGCDVAIYDPYWDLELYEQIIERVGPMRQMQAGLDRVVSVYHLQVEGTFDQAVFRRLTDKASVQQAVMEAVR